MNNAVPCILVADDNADDLVMLRRAFTRIGVTGRVLTVCDGAEAIDYLAGNGRFADRSEFPVPHVLLLDLKMPRRDGFDVLQWVRTQPGLKGLRVVVLTGCPDHHSVERAYELGATSFLQKPVDFTEFPNLIQTMQQFWTGCDSAAQSHPTRLNTGA